MHGILEEEREREYVLAVTWTPLKAAQGEGVEVLGESLRLYTSEDSIKETAGGQTDTWLVAAQYSEFTDLSCRLVQEAQATTVATLTPLEGDGCTISGLDCLHCHLCCPDARELAKQRQVRIAKWLTKLMETFVEHPGLLETCPSLDLFMALAERVQCIRTSYDSKT